jgi:hypothetical protein
MHVRIDLSAVRQTQWYEYALRFLFGGLITAVAAIIAKHFGPAVGGLFLAFPAIFPASATLIEKYERQRAQREGKPAEIIASKAVAVDAEGAALGSIGLIAFAAIAWKLLPHYPAGLVLSGAIVVWLAVAVVLWLVQAKLSADSVDSEEL